MKTPYKKLLMLSRSYSPKSFVQTFGFDETIKKVCDILTDKNWDENLQNYAALLLEQLKDVHQDIWNSTWVYNTLLGYAYDITLNYEARYQAYQRAFQQSKSPPPELLIALAHCCIAPEKPSISEEEAIKLVKQAMKDKLYIEGVSFLCGLYKSMNKPEEELYWKNVLEEIRNSGNHLLEIDKIALSTLNHPIDSE